MRGEIKGEEKDFSEKKIKHTDSKPEIKAIDKKRQETKWRGKQFLILPKRIKSNSVQKNKGFYTSHIFIQDKVN